MPIGSLTGNTVNVTGGTIAGDVCGGITAGAETRSGNVVIVFQGAATAPVVLEGGVYGGYSFNGGASGNRVEFISGTFTDDWEHLTGGYVFSSSASASNNSVIISGGQIDAISVSGGKVNDGRGDVINNSVEISGGQINATVSGGNSNHGSAINNRLEISGGTVTAIYGVYGGFASFDDGSVTGNSAIVSGGTVAGDIYGGKSCAGWATGNSVTIHAVADVSQSIVYGGDISSASSPAFVRSAFASSQKVGSDGGLSPRSIRDMVMGSRPHRNASSRLGEPVFQPAFANDLGCHRRRDSDISEKSPFGRSSMTSCAGGRASSSAR